MKMNSMKLFTSIPQSEEQTLGKNASGTSAPQNYAAINYPPVMANEQTQPPPATAPSSTPPSSTPPSSTEEGGNVQPKKQRSSHASEEAFAPFANKMRDAGLPTAAIRMFKHYYAQLSAGKTGFISGQEAQPVDTLPTVAELKTFTDAGLAALPQTVVIKLNGGLGTTMGMEGPKSLITVKDGLTFLDIIVRQILHLREAHGVTLPLVLMNSFNTQQASAAALAEYPALAQTIPHDFTQHRIPKIWQSDLSPVSWPQDPQMEWCPPGHGDIYLALQTSGMLQQLLEAGYTYAFISNADNLGATVDPDILGYFATNKMPFLMEVAKRTAADRKGGHLAQNAEQGLILREVAQCPPEELEAFQDIERYTYFNTNNLWVHLPTLQALLQERQGLLDLPLIRNEKPVDPTQPESPRVYQLETAMGHAIALFPNAQALQIERNRFLPVKSSNDLLVLWSDAYVLDADYQIRLNPNRSSTQPPLVELDKQFYALFADLQAHFPNGAPSLVNCSCFTVEGNVCFDADVVLNGEIHIRHPHAQPLHWTSE